MKQPNNWGKTVPHNRMHTVAVRTSDPQPKMKKT